MEGMTDWNKLTMKQYIEHLESKFRFDSSGTAKAVFELITAYKALLIPRVTNPVKIALLKQLEELSNHIPTETYTRKVIEIKDQFL